MYFLYDGNKRTWRGMWRRTWEWATNAFIRYEGIFARGQRLSWDTLPKKDMRRCVRWRERKLDRKLELQVSKHGKTNKRRYRSSVVAMGSKEALVKEKGNFEGTGAKSCVCHVQVDQLRSCVCFLNVLIDLFMPRPGMFCFRLPNPFKTCTSLLLRCLLHNLTERVSLILMIYK